MTTDYRYDGRVAVITGAGGGLGRAHALLFAARGAQVLVNDLGSSVTGTGGSSSAADAVVQEIRAAGGEAAASYDSVEDGDKIIQAALDQFGRVDILINNAGILRDVSFPKMTDADWEAVYRVHVWGAYKVTKAAWPHLREQSYGRVVMTSSASGIYGNFGQANYAMAKLGLFGFAQTLALEGAKYNIMVNAIAPLAGSRMTETIMPPEVVAALKPELVSPLVAYLCHDSSRESGGLYEVGAGWVGRVRWERSQGASFDPANMRIEDVAAAWGQINDWTEAQHPASFQDALAPVMAMVGRSGEEGA